MFLGHPKFHCLHQVHEKLRLQVVLLYVPKGSNGLPKVVEPEAMWGDEYHGDDRQGNGCCSSRPRCHPRQEQGLGQGSKAVLLESIQFRDREMDEGEFWNLVPDAIEVVDEMVEIVVEVVSVGDKVKVFGDLWDVWLWIDVEEEESEVVHDGDREVVGGGVVEVSDGSVIFLSWIEMVISNESG